MCTIFALSDDRQAFGGNNEDFFDPHNRIWFVPREGGKVNGVPFQAGRYARNYCGYRDLFPQGGINEKGLFFDFTAQAPLKLHNLAGKQRYGDDFTAVVDSIFAECATVEDVLDGFSRYYIEEEIRGAMFVADASGDAAVLEGDHVIRKDKHYLISTNFYQSQVRDRTDITCGRFRIAEQMLEAAADDVSVDTVRRVLAAVRQSFGSYTVYSQVYDLKKQLIYLYHFHNFENVKIIDPRDEWNKGEPVIYDIAELFPPTFAHQVMVQRFDFERDQMREKMAAEKKARGEIIELEPAQLERFVGRYQDEVFKVSDIDVYLLGRQLAVELRGMLGMLYPTSATTFCLFVPGAELRAEFETAKDGSVTRLNLETRPGWSMPYARA